MKLLVSDYDGTINFHGKIHKHDLESLNLFYNQGNIISIATSRPYKSLHTEMLRFKIPYDLLICNNGNAIFDKNGLIDYNCLSIEELIAFRNLIKEFPKNSIITACDAYGKITSNRPLYYEVSLGENYAFEKFYQLFCENGFSTDYYLNSGIVFSNKIQKDYATNYVLKKYGIEKCDVYTVGDGDNDFLMLKEFNGYTFPWSSPKVRKLKLPTVYSISQVINRIL